MASPAVDSTLPILDERRGSSHAPAAELTVVLVGNPNCGKTSLFNRLTGLRGKTANFSGTTVEHHRGRFDVAGARATLVDLPGMYSMDVVTEDERIASQVLHGDAAGGDRPDLIIAVLDATNLERSLVLAGQVIELQRPTIVAVNLADVARKQGVAIDVVELRRRLGCPVVEVSARTGLGIDALRALLDGVAHELAFPEIHADLAACSSCRGCQYAARFDWAAGVRAASLTGGLDRSPTTERVDRWLTHPVVGVAAFAVVMAALFMLVFWLAQWPMTWIEDLAALAQGLVGRILTEGDLSSLIVDGVISGVGSVLVFLPQICLLFLALALLEDTGYMARAAFVMDRLMQSVGLPGKAFVPLLSAHACAIPAIMSTRIIEDRRDRLATIMVIPLLTCSARVPVYAMVAAMLFPDDPVRASLLFTGAYALGIVAALGMGWVFKHSLLKGRSKPLVIELPNYRRPSLVNALKSTFDRAAAFVTTAGTTILVISMVMWALATYPKTSPDDLSRPLAEQYQRLLAAGDDAAADRLLEEEQLANSAAGRVGRTIEPLFAPLGFEWRTTVGVLTSFAAREVVVSTLSVLYGLGADQDDSGGRLTAALRSAKRADGAPAFTTASSLSLLVFFVLAMQCLPTQAVTRRETGSWKWALWQLSYMTLLAYGAAFVTFQVASRLAA